MRTAACLVLLGALLACPAASAVAPLPKFQHIVVVVFENKDPHSVLGSNQAPTFTSYARRFANLTRYYAVAHPSLPNYLALVSGSTQGIATNCTDCIVSAKSLADTVEGSGRSWKTYAEDLPRAGFVGAANGGYAKKHDPFLYFRDIVDDPARRARIVPFAQLRLDLNAQRLPDFSLVVPNLCNSMHDCSVAVGDAWLRRVAPSLLKLPETVVFTVFDEGASSVRGGGRTVALVLGTAVRPRSHFAGITGHYGVLRTIEDAWGLPRLGRSARTPPITGIWR